MAISQLSFYPDCSTLTNFKAWAQFISNFFTTAGWTAGTDTGQVNWGTIVSVPTSAGTAVYEIWKSADSGSTACPITIKVEYWSASNIPSTFFTVGTGGTDGAGNLNTPKSPRQALAAYSADASNLYPCYASGDSGSMRIVMFDNGSTSYPGSYQSFGFFVSRDYNTSGVIQANYVQVLWLTGQGGSPVQASQTIYNATNGGVTPQDVNTLLAALPFSYNLTAQYGANVLVSPVFPFVGALGNPNINHFLARINDFSDEAVFAMTVYNVSHTYQVWNQHIPWYHSEQVAFIYRWE